MMGEIYKYSVLIIVVRVVRNVWDGCFIIRYCDVLVC